MIPPLSSSAAGLSAAASRAAVAGEAIAGPADSAKAAAAPRISLLPRATDPLSALAFLIETEASFKANAAVLRTAAEMVEALYRTRD